MIFIETKIKGAFIIDVKRLDDDRGFFTRTFSKNEFEAHGLKADIVQVNASYNKHRATLRGLHMQLAPFEETKLVRCTSGAVFDVLVDLRQYSPTYKQWYGAELTQDNYRMLYIPGGCAHGYLTLENNCSVFYQVSQFYFPDSERGFRYDDPAFKIDWPIPPKIISEKDRSHPFIID